MILRDYQQTIYNTIRERFSSGYKRVLVVAPCGAGKSYIFAAMAERASENGSVLILCHRRELIKQHKQMFDDLGIDTKNIRIESVFTEVNNLGVHGQPRMIIVDEAHLSRANSWQQVISYYNTYTVGFSGTPCRLDNKPLGDLYETMIESATVSWLILNKYLAPYKYYAPMTVETENVTVRCGDYSVVELDKLMRDRVIYGNVIENYKKFADGVKTIVYCTSINHAREVASVFSANGYSAASIDSNVESKERDEIMDKFRSGEITILCNCGIISEGISVPDCGACILLRPTESLALHTQQSMRCMRYKEGKTAIIIDCVGNYTRHGLPDTRNEWSLTEPPKKRRIMDEKCNYTIRVCQKCFRPFKTADVCPWCGAEYKLDRKEIQAREEVRLAEIKAENVRLVEEEKKRQRIEQGMCKTESELVSLFLNRGMSRGAAWYRAKMIMSGRRKKTS